MKIKTDFGKLIIPKRFVEEFKKAKEKALEKKKDVDFWTQGDEQAFSEWFDETHAWRHDGEILDNQEEAEFIVSWTIMNVEDSFGGYPIEQWMEIKCNGYKIGFCCFGWTGLCEDCKGDLNTIGYKEKIKKKKNN